MQYSFCCQRRTSFNVIACAAVRSKHRVSLPKCNLSKFYMWQRAGNEWLGQDHMQMRAVEEGGRVAIPKVVSSARKVIVSSPELQGVWQSQSLPDSRVVCPSYSLAGSRLLEWKSVAVAL